MSAGHTCKNRIASLQLWDGDKLREWRERRGISAQCAAQALDVSRSTYYRYEAGSPPPVDVANALVRWTRGYIHYSDLWVGFDARYA